MHIPTPFTKLGTYTEEKIIHLALLNVSEPSFAVWRFEMLGAPWLRWIYLDNIRLTDINGKTEWWLTYTTYPNPLTSETKEIIFNINTYFLKMYLTFPEGAGQADYAFTLHIEYDKYFSSKALEFYIADGDGPELSFNQILKAKSENSTI